MRNRSETSKGNAVVIGAGLGGLGIAALLGKDGWDVTVLEKNTTIGGRARIWESKGFRFDMGPSWYLMPDVFERFFSLFEKNVSDLYTLTPLDPQYRIFFHSGETVDVVRDFEKNMEMFESLSHGASKEVRKYLEPITSMYHTAIDTYVWKNYSSIFDFLKWDLIASSIKLPLFQNLDAYISRHITDERVRKILLYSTVFLGGSPKNTPAIYALMNYLDFFQGVYYPSEGIYTIVETLKTICEEHGVKIHCNTEVTHIDDKGENRAEVSTRSGKTYTADIVVSNADYHHTETELLQKTHQSYPEGYWKKKTIAPSAFIIYLGIKGSLPSLTHHNLYFSRDWDKGFDDIFTLPQWPKDPSLYVCVPSKTDPTVAPAGHENMFILCPIAPGLFSTKEEKESFANTLISRIEDVSKESFSNRIVIKRIFSSEDFLSDYHSYKGTALGLAHTLFQTAYFRPSNQSKKVKNLFYVGQHTIPGIGMPMVLVSAFLVRERIRQQYG